MIDLPLPEEELALPVVAELALPVVAELALPVVAEFPLKRSTKPKLVEDG